MFRVDSPERFSFSSLGLGLKTVRLGNVTFFCQQSTFVREALEHVLRCLKIVNTHLNGNRKPSHVWAPMPVATEHLQSQSAPRHQHCQQQVRCWNQPWAHNREIRDDAWAAASVGLPCGEFSVLLFQRERQPQHALNNARTKRRQMAEHLNCICAFGSR